MAYKEVFQQYIFLKQRVAFSLMQLETLLEAGIKGNKDPSIAVQVEQLISFVEANSFSKEELKAFMELNFTYHVKMDTIIEIMGKNPEFIKMFLKFENIRDYKPIERIK